MTYTHHITRLIEQWERVRMHREFAAKRATPPTPAEVSILMDALAIQGKTALDYGCGDGLFAEYMLAHGATHVTGFDISPHARECAASHLGHENRFQVVDKQQLDDTQPVDVVFCRRVLPYLDIDTLIEDIQRLLKPGGLLYLQYHAPGFYRYHLCKRPLRPIVALTNGYLLHNIGKRLQFAWGGWTLNDTMHTRTQLTQQIPYKEVAFRDDPMTPEIIFQRPPIHERTP
jgi:SAM-dependent methyltransferase